MTHPLSDQTKRREMDSSGCIACGQPTGDHRPIEAAVVMGRRGCVHLRYPICLECHTEIYEGGPLFGWFYALSHRDAYALAGAPAGNA